jgi:hypothetical protein
VAHLLRQGAEPAPESSAIQGLPAIRYNLPNIPIAHAIMDTPTATVEAQLLLRGNLTAVLNEPMPGLSVDQSGWRDDVTHKINGIGSGIRISGIPDNPSIGVTEGSQFNLMETRFTPPNTVSFIGQARVAMPPFSTRAGKVRVTGQPGCELRVTITPKPQPQGEGVPVRVPEQSPVPSWWSQHASEIGTIALAVVVIGGLVVITAATEGAATPATGPLLEEEVLVVAGVLAR